ncbi:MAG TPA: multicopper oxidase family protein [Bryobacteraceae bacterium]|nr:multicopper oxidase family protein [Bryobacteraceae bacterium]
MNRRDFLLTAGAIATQAGRGLIVPQPLEAAGKADHVVRIAPVSFDIAPGKTIKTIGYNGAVPGPLIRMKEGKQATVDIFNDTDNPEFVHWHGMFISTKADGSEEEGSPVVPPHGHLRISFTPKPAGTRWYHTHSMAMDDLAKGAYSGQFGFLYVEPKSEPGNYDQEVFLASRHWEPKAVQRGDPNNDWAVVYASATLGDRSLGHGEPIRVKKGQRVLFHLLNADATRDIDLALPGHQFKVIALDGNPVPNPANVDSLQLVVAERVDAVVEMNNPGVWILGSPREDERRLGLGVVIEYENQKGEPQWKDVPNTPWDYTRFGNAPGANPSPVEKTFDLSFHMLGDEGHAFNKWTVNGKSWPNIDPLIVKAGKRYRIAFHSGHEDGHPVHLHRHSFEIVKAVGKPTSGIFKDVVRVPRDGNTEVEFVADNPGTSLLHCHMQQHMDYGFKLLVKYA